MRTSPVHYIAPSDISITPNANNSANDLAVYVARGAKIKVYSPLSGVDTVNGTYQEWTLSGRNRRLVQPKDEQGRDINTPYTIYARLKIATRYTSPEKIAEAYADGYLIFAPKLWDDEKSEWYDKYAYISPEGRVGHWTPEHYLNYFVRLGDVSIIENGKRTITLDTGILGTELFNTEWALNPDSMPLRIYLTSMISNQDAGPTPYVYWGQTLVLSASLIEGWTGTDIQRFDHWEILRDTGSDADTAWNTAANASDFRTTGVIELMHGRGATQGVRDDFNSAVNTTFIVNAMERTDDPEEGGTPTYTVLKSASIGIMAETWEKYELSLAAQMVTYNPITQSYSPNNGVKFNIRATDQKNNVFLMTNKQVGDTRLVAQYAPVDVSPEVWSTITISGPDANVAEGIVPKLAFEKYQKSINVRLLNADNKELHRTTIAFLKDGEDSKEREWIFLRSATEITFGTQEHPYPSSIAYGEVNPPNRAAGHVSDNKNQDGWVPEGWWDDEQGVTSQYPYEYGAYRDYDHANDQWGAFTTPKIWHHYGKDADVWTIGNDGYWYKNGVKTNTKAEGKDGTGVEIKGGVDVLFNADKTSQSQTSLEGLTGMTVGDCYTVTANKHLYFYDGTTAASAANPVGWRDLGKFSGDDGQSSYMHIAYADDVIFDSQGHPTSCTGFTIVKQKEAYDWIGLCTNNSQTDPTTYTAYEWNKVKGAQGDSITKTGEEAGYQVSDSGTTTPSGTWYNTKQAAIDAYNTAHSISGHDWQPDTFMWTRTTITWSDNSTTVLYGAERNPSDGEPGMSIVIDSQVVDYCRRTAQQSQADPTTLTYGTYPSTLNEGDWLYTRTTVIYKTSGGASAGTTVSYSVSRIGENGNNGIGISGITEHYKASANATGETTPAGTQAEPDWGTNPMPSDWGEANGKIYLWNYEKIAKVDGQGNTTYERTVASVVAIWTKGVDSIANYYKASDKDGSDASHSETRPSTDPTTGAVSGWTVAVQNPTSAVPYLWTYEKVTYTDGSVAYTAPHVIGHYGKDADVWTIGNDGYWYKNGVKTNTKAEGKDGTGVEIKGGVDVLFNADKTSQSQTSLEGLTGMTVGDCYTVTANKHLYFYDGTTAASAANPVGWRDLGKFSGDDGQSSYIHIAYADNVTFDAQGAVTSVTGFSVTKQKDAYDWIGLCTDNNPIDPGASGRDYGSDLANARYYEWNKVKGTNAQYIYLKGTARDEDSETKTTIPCAVNVNGGTNQATTLRGLNLVIINRQTLSVVESINYDTYGEAAETGTGITDLIAELNALDNSVFVCLVSYDAVGWSAGLIAKLQEYGMGDLPYTDTGRHPFLFIGYKGLGNGNGLMRMRDVGAYTDVVELSVYVANGALSSHDGQNGADGAKGEDAVNVVVSPASMIVEQDINNKNNIEYAADNNLGMFSIQVLKGIATACTITRIVATASQVYVYNSPSTGQQDPSVPCDWQPNSQIANLYLKGIAKDNQNNYYTTGQIVLAITYTDPDTNTSKTISSIITKVYVNLIGSWSEKVENDMKTELAHSSLFDIDNDPTSLTYGDVIETENWGEFYRSSTENISRLTKKVNDGKNLLTLVRGWEGPGGTVVQYDEKNFGVRNRNDALYSPVIFGIEGESYCFSVYIDSNKHLGGSPGYCYDGALPTHASDLDDNGTFVGATFIEVPDDTITIGDDTYQRYYFIIPGNVVADKYFTIYNDGNYWFYCPQLEVGAVPTAFSAGTIETTSQIKQTADKIDASVRDDLGEVGINISGPTKTINLQADKVTFSDAQGGNTDKIQIDPTTGTMRMVNAIITGATMIDSVKTFDLFGDLTDTYYQNVEVYDFTTYLDDGETTLSKIWLLGNRFIFTLLASRNYSSRQRKLYIHIPPAEFFKGQTILINNGMFEYVTSGVSRIEVWLHVDTEICILNKDARDSGDIADNDSAIGKIRPSTGEMYAPEGNEEWLINGIFYNNLRDGMLGAIMKEIEITDFEWIELTAWESHYYNEDGSYRHAIEWKVIRWSKDMNE